MFKKKTYCLCLKPIFKISSFSLSIAFKKKKKNCNCYSDGATLLDCICKAKDRVTIILRLLKIKNPVEY